MSTSVGLSGATRVWVPPPSRPLDEAAWQVWDAKGRVQDERGSAARMKAVKWVSITVLLVAAALWSQLTPYEVVVRFIVAAGAIFVMFQAFAVRRYTVGAVFGAIALLYNPMAAIFSFSGDWQRVLVVVSALPFVASLSWRNERLAHNN